MDYKEKILRLLDKVNSENTLKRVYKLLEILFNFTNMMESVI